MPLLAKSGRRAIACDLPGLGDSDLLPGGIQYDTGGIADMLAKALQSLGVAQADVVGHDVGTWIAFAYATRHPDAVRRLVLSEAGIPGVTPDSTRPRASRVAVVSHSVNVIDPRPTTV